MSDQEDLPSHPNRGTEYSPGKGKKVSSCLFVCFAPTHTNIFPFQFRTILCETKGVYIHLDLCVDSFDNLRRTLGAQIGEGLFEVPDLELIYFRHGKAVPSNLFSLQLLTDANFDNLEDHIYFGLSKGEVEDLIKARKLAVINGAERWRKEEELQVLEKEKEKEKEEREVVVEFLPTRKRKVREKEEDKEVKRVKEIKEVEVIEESIVSDDAGKRHRKTERERYLETTNAQQRRVLADVRAERSELKKKIEALEKTIAQKDKDLAREREKEKEAGGKGQKFKEDIEEQKQKFEAARADIKLRSVFFSHFKKTIG